MLVTSVQPSASLGLWLLLLMLDMYQVPPLLLEQLLLLRAQFQVGPSESG
jgi:hypothetical protein